MICCVIYYVHTAHLNFKCGFTFKGRDCNPRLNEPSDPPGMEGKSASLSAFFFFSAAN